MAHIKFPAAMALVDMSWPEFKTIVASKNLLMQWIENDESHTVFAIDEGIVYVTTLWKVGAIASGIPASNAADLAEFVSTYQAQANKPLVPRNPAGYPVSAPSFLETDGATGQIFGIQWTTPAGTQTFQDVVVTNQIHIQGGRGWVVGANKGDYAEFSVVDKDNVTGMFDGTDPNSMNPGLTNLGLIVGTDVLELTKYVKSLKFKDGDQEFKVKFDSKADVFPGLYLRASYVSTGATDVDMAANYMWYED